MIPIAFPSKHGPNLSSPSCPLPIPRHPNLSVYPNLPTIVPRSEPCGPLPRAGSMLDIVLARIFVEEAVLNDDDADWNRNPNGDF